MKTDAFKIAFIGSHGVGKTTLCYGLAARLKAADQSLEVVGEVARRCPLPINRSTTLAAQAWILHTQIAEELVASSKYDVVICDRSVIDNYVYLLLAAAEPVDLDPLVNTWTRSYDLLIHVPILSEPRADGIRSTDPSFQLAVQQRLELEIQHRNVPVLSLAGIPREQWLDYAEEAVLARLGPVQLELT